MFITIMIVAIVSNTLLFIILNMILENKLKQSNLQIEAIIKTFKEDLEND